MDAVLDRIRKLLLKANDKSVGEAESAAFFAKVTQLLTEHNLDIHEVNLGNNGNADEAFVEENVHSTGRWTFPNQAAYSVVSEFCFVKGIFYSKKGGQRLRKVLNLFGTKSNVETARWMFQALLGAYERLFNAHRARTGCPVGHKNMYIDGVTSGFTDKMKYEREKSSLDRDIDKKLTSGETALAIRTIEENTMAAFNDRHGNNKPSNIKYGEGTGTNTTREAGYQAGQKLTLNRAIGETTQGKLQ